MDTFVNAISLPWVGTVLGLVGVVLAIYFYLRARKVVRISYEIEETVVVGTPDETLSDDLKVLFRGVDVPAVTSTKFTIWNSGNSTIRRSDIAEGDLLTLVVPDGSTFLHGTILSRTRSVNDFKIIVDDQSSATLLDFAFFDPRDGASISILHTSPPGTIDIKGTVIGLRGGMHRVLGSEYWLDKLIWMAVIMIPTFLLAMPLSVFLQKKRDDAPLGDGVPESFMNTWPKLAVLFGGLVVISAVMLLVIRLLPRRFSWRRIPTGLE